MSVGTKFVGWKKNLSVGKKTSVEKRKFFGWTKKIVSWKTNCRLEKKLLSVGKAFGRLEKKNLLEKNPSFVSWNKKFDNWNNRFGLLA